MNNEKRSLLSMFENCVDILLNIIAIVAAYTFVLLFREPTVFLSDYGTIFSLFIVLLFSMPIYQSSRTYKKIPFIGNYQYAFDIVKANLIIYGIAILLLLLLNASAARGFILIWGSISFVFSTGALLFKKKLIITAVRTLRRKNYNVRRVIVVGDNADSANAFVNQVINDPDASMIVLGAVGKSMGDGMVCDNLGDFENLEEILDTYKPDDVVFAIDAYNKSNIISLVNICDDRCIKVYFLPVIYGFFKTIRQVERVGNIPIINIHSTPLDSRFNLALKRTLDITVSLALIIITSPIMLGIAIGVKLSSDGPIFFRQERVGKMGKPFKIFKFRSMHTTSGKDNTWTTAEDTRRTKFGAFLRRSSLDELPQLFNVLAGSMSLVGPRPEVPHFVEHFKNEVPLYMVKHYVKPGITGLAQVKGLRGNTPVEERIAADISYIENWSFLLDLFILLKTPFKAYNSEEKYVDSSKLDDGSDNDIMFDFSTMKSSPAPSAKDITHGTQNKKILYCASRVIHIENSHKDYISALREDGNEVLTLASGEGADYDIPFEKKIFSLSNFRLIKQIKKIISDGKFDVIVLNTSLAAFFVRLALPKKERPRVVNFVHGYLFSKNTNALKSKMLFTCEKMLRKKTDDIIVMNKHDYKTAVKNKLCREHVYFVKGMGAEVRDMITEPEHLRRKHACEGKYVMTFVGELSDRKNQAFLIKAMPKIKKLIPSAVLWLVGNGNKKSELEKLAKELNVSGDVIFMGSRADACDYIRASNIYVSASASEGMPFNIIEALGIGVTVIASRVKGHTDLITNGKDGCLYTFNNSDDFITKIYKVYTRSVRIPKEYMLKKYEKYTKNSVFKDTFSVLLSSVSGEVVYADREDLSPRVQPIISAPINDRASEDKESQADNSKADFSNTEVQEVEPLQETFKDKISSQPYEAEKVQQPENKPEI